MNKNLYQKARKLLIDCLIKGKVEIALEVYLCDSYSLKKLQKDWTDEDPRKHMDFSIAPTWITTDEGLTTEPIRTAHELVTVLKKLPIDKGSL